MRKYNATWNEIKRTGKAQVVVSSEAARTVINGIKLAKTTENVARRQVGLVGWSKLVIKQERLSATRVKITLELLYSTQL